MGNAEEKLVQMGIELPEPPVPSPLADHVMVKRSGDYLFLSGMGPLRRGMPAITGRLVKDMKHEDGYEAARLAALNLLSLIRKELGSLDQVAEIVKLVGYVACDDDFYDQYMILNGACHLFHELFGDKGAHVCTAVGTHVLPFHMPVVLDLVVRVKA